MNTYLPYDALDFDDNVNITPSIAWFIGMCIYLKPYNDYIVIDMFFYNTVKKFIKILQIFTYNYTVHTNDLSCITRISITSSYIKNYIYPYSIHSKSIDIPKYIENSSTAIKMGYICGIVDNNTRPYDILCDSYVILNHINNIFLYKIWKLLMSCDIECTCKYGIVSIEKSSSKKLFLCNNQLMNRLRFMKNVQYPSMALSKQ